MPRPSSCSTSELVIVVWEAGPPPDELADAVAAAATALDHSIHLHCFPREVFLLLPTYRRTEADAAAFAALSPDARAAARRELTGTLATAEVWYGWPW